MEGRGHGHGLVLSTATPCPVPREDVSLPQALGSQATLMQLPVGSCGGQRRPVSCLGWSKAFCANLNSQLSPQKARAASGLATCTLWTELLISLSLPACF